MKLKDWLPRKTYTASGDAPKLRALLCRLGFCSPYYNYGVGELYGYGEFTLHRTTHLGWHCTICERKLKRPHKWKSWVVWNA